jgi:hypothetical protein
MLPAHPDYARAARDETGAGGAGSPVFPAAWISVDQMAVEKREHGECGVDCQGEWFARAGHACPCQSTAGEAMPAWPE